MAEVILFPHNETAYAALKAGLEDNNFAFIERATGTGKSYILIKYMHNDMPGKRILFVTLHNSMFKQLNEKDMPSLGVSRSEFEKLDCILYSSINKHSAEWYLNNYDCIIFDEAHHCGAPKWSEVISEVRDLVKSSTNKKMIGATATATRYLDDYLDVSKEYFEGNVVSKLYLSDAILNEILPAPFYINLNHSSYDKIVEIRKKLNKLSMYKELDQIRDEVSKYEDNLKTKTDIPALLKKYNVKSGEKYIIFCSSIDEINRKKDEAKEWFKNIAPVEIYEAHSKQQEEVNDYQISSFDNNNNSNTVKLMFAVDMFNEGLHLNSVDGIFMTRRTTSPILYLQQIGRVLSYSVRKKQVKIFDLVGNATDIEVIYNLYKEMLATAKSEIEKNHDKKDYYQTIIDRFKIIEAGTDLIDELDRINNYLDNNYLNKEKIDIDIHILKTYIENNNINFMELLYAGKVDYDHVRAYKELQKLSDNISFENYMELNKIGVIITDYQSDIGILNKIKQYGSYSGVINNEITNIMNDYNLFYLQNNRRPCLLIPEETLLVKQYRSILVKYNRKVIAKYLKDSSYPLNVEELLLLKDYPTSLDIEEYINVIEKKYENSVPLDDLEKSTLTLLDKVGYLKNRPIASTLTSSQVIKIDQAIGVLKSFLIDNPNMDFSNEESYKGKYDIYVAIKTIRKNERYITNLQFETLLNMKGALSSKMDMSLEKRKELLGEYNSFYEKEVATNLSSYQKIAAFVSKNKRRPDKTKEDEKDLALKLESFISEKNNSWTKKVIKILYINNIPLTVDEKIISDYEITKEDLDIVFNEITDLLNNFDEKTFNALLFNKKIKLLLAKNYIDEKLYKILKRTISLVEYVLNDDDDPKIIERAKKYLYNNQAIVPYGLIGYIYLKYGISLLSINRNSKNSNGEINIAHKRYIEEMRTLEDYFTYIENNNERPENYSILTQKVEKYLLSVTARDVRSFCDRLQKLGISINKNELFLARLLTEEKQKELYEELKEKRKNNIKLSIIETQIFSTLNLKYKYNFSDFKQRDNSISEFNREINMDIIEELKGKIRENPFEKLDFDNTQISERDKNTLIKYRLVCIGKIYIAELINSMKNENKTYKELLNEENLNELNEIIKAMKSSNDGLDLIDELEKVNKQIAINNNNFDIQLFINEYLAFIDKSGKIPELGSDNLEELGLAKKYQTVIELINSKEKSSFTQKIKKHLENSEKIYFYYNFIDFVEKNKRFPSPLSDDENEIKLAMQYQKYGSILSKEQRKNINKLMIKYQQNTIKYIQLRKEK